MRKLGDPIKHLWLVKGMARASGVDLVEAVHEGKLSQADWADMVTRCRGCAHPDCCGANMRATTPPAEPLSYCRNAEVLEKLAQV